MSRLRVGDRVRRRGMLASVFGDEVGTVVNVHHRRGADAFEVRFGTRQIIYTSHQIVRSDRPSFMDSSR